MEGAVLDTIVGISVLVFVLSSMLSMGFSLTIPQIISPLRDVRLVLIALAVNFIAVPLLAYLIDLILSLDESLFVGLILIATAAGAPFLPKLAEVAKGDIALSVGLMVLLMVVTVAYMPIALPLLLEDVEINAWEIASSLIFLMILPLAIGLFFKWRYEGVADTLSPPVRAGLQRGNRPPRRGWGHRQLECDRRPDRHPGHRGLRSAHHRRPAHRLSEWRITTRNSLGTGARHRAAEPVCSLGGCGTELL